MKNPLPYLTATAALALVACGGASTEPKAYDANSWQTMISADCESFFDGCNTCRRAPGSDIAACTKKACQEYQEPKCLDE